MQYVTLGRTGIRVSRFCLGAMELQLLKDEQLAFSILDRGIELGINFFDTANSYGLGASEELVGRWLKSRGHRHQIVLSTKVRHRMGPSPNDEGLSRVHILQAVEASLRRLGTDYIDSYILHQPDHSTPIETTLRAIDDLVGQGKVRTVGCSNYAAWLMCKALWVSDRCDLARIESTQSPYNLLNRQIEVELLPLCQSEQVGVIVYNPTAAGLLTGRYAWGEPPFGSRFQRQNAYRERYWYEANFRIVHRIEPIAAAGGRTLPQYALAWILGHPGADVVLLGAESSEQLEENVAAADRPLSEAERRAGIDASVGAICGQLYFR
jgi:aryl-alcohol dehydrogenase-like predicted oxidoreductase